MKNKIYLLLSLALIFLSIFLRIYKMENRAPFDWDQNRDFSSISEIASGKFTLIGPVAKGEGGFFLGPLYYYLATPAFLFLHGSPFALPLTSIILDVSSIIAILYFLKSILGRKIALSLGFIWSISWFAIEMSRISWNVAVLPLWTVFFLYILSTKTKFTSSFVFGLGLLAGLSWHIHAALIPLSLILASIYYKKWFTDIKSVAIFGIGYLLPLTPLILFDLRHNFLNLHLMFTMIASSAKVSVEPLTLINAIFMRLGKNIQAIFLGISSYNLILGYLMAACSIFCLFREKGIYRLSAMIIILNLLAVLALKEPGFPEYYLAFSYLPSIILILRFFSKFTLNHAVFLFLFLAAIGYFNIKNYTVKETSFGLSRKISVAKLMNSFNTPIDLHLQLAPGREGGILAFYRLGGGQTDKNSRLKIIVSDQNGGPIIINGELATDIGYFGGIRVAKFVVQ